jgi:hypothetical protein
MSETHDAINVALAAAGASPGALAAAKVAAEQNLSAEATAQLIAAGAKLAAGEPAAEPRSEIGQVPPPGAPVAPGVQPPPGKPPLCTAEDVEALGQAEFDERFSEVQAVLRSGA